ncbi:MAG: TlpA family protein disulfide reductase [Salinibacter sp.]
MPVKPFWTCLVALCTLTVLPAAAQQSSQNCQAGRLSLTASADSAGSSSAGGASAGTAPAVKQPPVTHPKPAVAVTPTTAAERRVQNVIEADGLHVVHFWAPWCPNSKRELANGWASLVADNPNVSFTFVTVWNDGEDGAQVLDKYNLPDRVTEVTQPDLGPSDQASNRRQSFLSHPVTWIPSTWIFHNNGELAFALNYGEMKMSTIQSLLDATRKDW